MILKVVDKNGQVSEKCENSESCSLLYTKEYAQGDKIILEVQKAPCYCIVQFEDSLPPQLIYITQREISYQMPFANDRIVFSPKAFSGARHVVRARFATEKEISARQNLALNVYSRHGDNGYYPHASANVETRGEAVFAAYNAIDGVYENDSHGQWPHQSWGINRDPNAAITINFGKEVEIDEIGITLRADFPHDSYWTSGTVSFSDGSSEVLSLEKTEKPQRFIIEKRTVTSAKFDKLIKADDESPFPALTQIEFFGTHL